MARHYTTNQVKDMTGEELIRNTDLQAEIVERIDLLEDGQITSNDEHNRRVALLNLENFSAEWARRFEG